MESEIFPHNAALKQLGAAFALPAQFTMPGYFPKTVRNGAITTYSRGAIAASVTSLLHP